MKHLLITIALLPICSLFLSAQTDADRAAIKKATLKNTQLYFAGDWAARSEGWVQEPYVKKLSSTPYNMVFLDGWSEVEAQAKLWEGRAPMDAKIERRDYKIDFINPKMAFVKYTQIVNDRPPADELVLMEKIKGEWKIVMLMVLGDQHLDLEGFRERAEKIKTWTHDMTPGALSGMCTEQLVNSWLASIAFAKQMGQSAGEIGRFVAERSVVRPQNEDLIRNVRFLILQYNAIRQALGQDNHIEVLAYDEDHARIRLNKLGEKKVAATDDVSYEDFAAFLDAFMEVVAEKKELKITHEWGSEGLTVGISK